MGPPSRPSLVEATTATGTGAVDIAKGPRPVLTKGRDATREVRLSLERVRPGVGGRCRAEVLTVLGTTETPKRHRTLEMGTGLGGTWAQGTTPFQAAVTPSTVRRQTSGGPTQGHTPTLTLRLLPPRPVGLAELDAVAPVVKGAAVLGPVLPRGSRKGGPELLLVGAIDKRPVEGVAPLHDVLVLHLWRPRPIWAEQGDTGPLVEEWSGVKTHPITVQYTSTGVSTRCVYAGELH